MSQKVGQKESGARQQAASQPVFRVRPRGPPRGSPWRKNVDRALRIKQTESAFLTRQQGVGSHQKCYWQIPIDPRDRDKTTFTSHFGTYRFKRMPFGLRNAPATFQRAIDMILFRVKWPHCLVYLDDVVVFSTSVQDPVAHLDNILGLLGSAVFSLKLKKCDFFTRSVNYLGYVIRPGRLALAEKNIRALREAKHPANQTELRSFLGLCNL